MVGSLSLGEEKQETLVERCIPVKTNAEHAIVPEGRHKEVLVFSALAKSSQRPIAQRDLPNPDKYVLTDQMI